MKKVKALWHLLVDDYNLTKNNGWLINHQISMFRYDKNPEWVVIPGYGKKQGRKKPRGWKMKTINRSLWIIFNTFRHERKAWLK